MKTELKYGIIAGLSSIVWLYIEFAIGFHEKHIEFQPIASSISIIIPIVFIALGIAEKRRKKYAGLISYWRAVVCGLLIVLISSIIYAIGLTHYCYDIYPDFLQNIKEYVHQDLLKAGKSAVFAEEMTAIYNHPAAYVVRSFTGAVLGGFIIVLVIATLYRSRKD